MNKMLTLSQRCSPNLLTEQLTQQQLYIRLIAKLFKLLRSLDNLSNLFNLLTPMSTLSSFAETRMDKGLDKDVQVNILDEQVDKPKTQGTSRAFALCGTQGRKKALVTETSRGGHVGVVCTVSVVVTGGISIER